MISSNKRNSFDSSLEQKTDNKFFKSDINLDFIEEPQKKGLLAQFLSKFRKEEVIDSKDTLKDYSYEYSKFREYVFLLDDSEDDSNVLKVIELCDDSLKLDRHRLL